MGASRSMEYGLRSEGGSIGRRVCVFDQSTRGPGGDDMENYSGTCREYQRLRSIEYKVGIMGRGRWDKKSRGPRGWKMEKATCVCEIIEKNS